MGIRKGCFQCNKRRITCDGASPQCNKCARKGLECSGNGVRYRFNESVASRGKLRGCTVPVLADWTSDMGGSNPSSSNESSVDCTRESVKSFILDFEQSSTRLQHIRKSHSVPLERIFEHQPIISRCLERTSSQTRMLFDHCTYYDIS